MLRKFSLISLLVLLPALAFGDAQPQFLRLNNWSKGLNSNVSDYSVPD